ncbi:HTH-type transcriptional regulator CysL [Falsiruegeria mediterranea M17]|uniref:HTH-type transcriptional regulator CysL n=1 Tax=Falsiruegeria mediterranea M17 TaxID=1200281 RepID=A0A2R8CC22_9RHOB|nr:HTH-type transcriptional regulator CysL [Falsiruegeria mediterranea M17]
MEEEIGETLFHRTRKRLRPTREAEVFLPEAIRIVSAIDGIPEIFAQNRAESVAPLRILCLPRIDLGLVIPTLALLDAETRNQRYKVVVCPRREFSRRLRHGQFDVGVSTLPVPVEGLQTHFLTRAPLKVMLPQNHPLAQRDVLSPSDLSKERYIALEEHTIVRTTVDRALAAAGATLNLSHEVSSSEVAHRFVRNGMGFTFADPSALPPEISDEIALIPWSLGASIELAYFLPQVSRPHENRDTFLKLLKDVCKDRYGQAHS